MNAVASLARAWGSARTIAGAASVAGWSRRPTLQWPDRTAQDLAHLDAVFQTSLRIQLETARRYDRRFTLTSTALSGGEPVQDAAHDPAQDPAQVAAACARHIRVLDAVTLIDGALVMLWGSTAQTEVAAALERLIAAGVLPPSSLERTGAATFPMDGLTAVSLTEAAAAHIGTLPPSTRPHPPTRLHAVATAPPSARAEGDHSNGNGLTAVGG